MRFQVVDAHVEESLAKTAINMRLEQYFMPVAHKIGLELCMIFLKCKKTKFLDTCSCITVSNQVSYKNSRKNIALQEEVDND